MMPVAAEPMLFQSTARHHRSLIPHRPESSSIASLLTQVRSFALNQAVSVSRNSNESNPTAGQDSGDIKQGDIVKQLQPLMEEIMEGLRGDHAEDQAEILRHSHYLQKCTADVTSRNASLVAPRLQSLKQKKSALSSCEVGLGAMNTSSTTSCSDAHDYIKNELSLTINCTLPNDISAAAIREYLDCANSSLNTKFARAEELHSMCEGAAEQKSKFASTCRDMKREVLTSQCEVDQLITTTCDMYSACHGSETGRYATAISAVAVAESGRKREAVAHAKVTCFLTLILENVSDLGGAAGRAKIAHCESLELNATEFQIEYPAAARGDRSECPLHGIEGAVSDFCQTVSLHNSTLDALPADDLGLAECKLGVGVLLSNPWGEFLSETDGLLHLESEPGADGQWVLERAGSGRVYITSHRGAKLEDIGGRVVLGNDTDVKQQWTIKSADETGRLFFLMSHEGTFLEDHHAGGVGLTTNKGLWQQWSVRISALGSPACNVTCAPTVEKDLELADCPDSSSRGVPVSESCYGAHNGVGWRGHMVEHSGNCRVAYQHSREEGVWTGKGLNCVILVTNGTIPDDGSVRATTEEPHAGPQILEGWKRAIPDFSGSVVHCLSQTDWSENTVDFPCQVGNMVMVAESYSYGFHVSSLMECAAR